MSYHGNHTKEFSVMHISVQSTFSLETGLDVQYSQFKDSLTFKRRQFLEFTIFANVESGRALSLVFLDVRRARIFDFVDLCWRRDVGSGRELLL